MQGPAHRGAGGDIEAVAARGQRVLVTYLTPTAITKNRVGIDQDIPIERGVNPLAQWLPAQPETAQPETAQPETAQPETAPAEPATTQAEPATEATEEVEII